MTSPADSFLSSRSFTTTTSILERTQDRIGRISDDEYDSLEPSSDEAQAPSWSSSIENSEADYQSSYGEEHEGYVSAMTALSNLSIGPSLSSAIGCPPHKPFYTRRVTLPIEISSGRDLFAITTDFGAPLSTLSSESEDISSEESFSPALHGTHFRSPIELYPKFSI